jgi:hypothetical protein
MFLCSVESRFSTPVMILQRDDHNAGRKTSSTNSLLAPDHSPGRIGVERINRTAGCHEQPVALLTAEAKIGTAFG